MPASRVLTHRHKQTTAADFLAPESRWRRFALLSAILECGLFVTGCVIIPVPVPTVIQNPAGLEVKLPKFTIVPGQTTRKEAEEVYKDFAVDSGLSHLLWARYRKSSWATYIAVGPPDAAITGGGRDWGTYNLLVRFDSNDKVRDSETVRDRELLDRLGRFCREENLAPLDLSQPINMGGPAFPHPENTYELQLTPNQVIVTLRKPTRTVNGNPRPERPEIGALPVAYFVGLAVGDGELPNSMTVTLRYSQKTRFGKFISFVTAPSTVITLLRWQQQVGNGTLKKENSL